MCYTGNLEQRDSIPKHDLSSSTMVSHPEGKLLDFDVLGRPWNFDLKRYYVKNVPGVEMERKTQDL